MDKIEFKKLLFKIAFATMACDGHIDEREIHELKLMDKNTSFFDAVDLGEELQLLIRSFEKDGVRIVENIFKSLTIAELNPIQELVILEVALRIINADDKHDENEIKFVNLLRGKLKVHDEIINDRFGKLEILHTNEYSRNITSKDMDSFHLPEIGVIKEIDFKLEKETE